MGNTGHNKIASDYLTEEEMAVTKFKKPKKIKKRKAKILKADDLIDMMEKEKSELPSNTSLNIEWETAQLPKINTEDDDDTSKLTAALQRTRDRLKKLKQSSAQDDAAE